MMRWFRLALFCWLLLCALRSLTLPVNWNHPLQVVDLGAWLDPARACAVYGRTASAVRSMECDLVRTRSLISVVLDCRWTQGNLAPARAETMDLRNRSELAKLPVKPATPTNTIEHRILDKNTGLTQQF
jgi:hypothetical protein